MQRVVLLVMSAALAACSGSVVPGPVVDAAPSTTSLQAPIGSPCRAVESFWCANYMGVCFESVCRAWCSAVDVPRCVGRAHEQYEDLGNAMACFCMPD